MKLHEKKIYLMTNYEQLRNKNYKNKFKKPLQNNNYNVYPLKPEFRQYVNKKTIKYNPEAKVKSVFTSVIIIFLWCLSMCLLAKASYPILQQICINSVQELDLDRK
ncbi:MAG: hypothetical protein AAFW70_18050 [Cyanobacteria bacterium J06635_10]